MSITQFDRAACKTVADKALESLIPMAVSLGLHIRKLPGNYSGTTFTMKIEFSTIDEEGVANTGIRKDYLFHCPWFNLKPEWLDKVFFLDSTGESYKVIGLKPKSRKFPVLAEEVKSKKVYKFPATTVMRSFFKGEK